MDYTARLPVSTPPDEDNSALTTGGPSLARSKTDSMMTFALSKRPRTTRAKFPKVRTGCITCKKRHVKCDETKPSCTRCLKWRGICSGYEQSPDRASHTPERSFSTLSRSASLGETPVTKPDQYFPSYRDIGITITRSRSVPPSRENMSMSPPNNQTPPASYCSAFEASFWNETVPRLAEENSAVKSANEAVHILILAKQPSLMSADADPSEDHYGGALRRYGAALREVRETSVSHDGDLRPAILCSMFFVIFEIINGDQNAAEAHLFNGQRMMDELQRSGGHGLDTGGSTPGEGQTKSLRKELKHVLRFLALQARSHGVVRWEREMRRQNSSFEDFGDLGGTGMPY